MKSVEVFLGVDMRCAHEGLIEIAKKYKVDFDKLKSGDVLLFINASKDRIKALSWNGVLSYINFRGKRKLDLDAIEFIPQAFSKDGVMQYSKAIKLTLKKKLGAKRFEELERC